MNRAPIPDEGRELGAKKKLFRQDRFSSACLLQPTHSRKAKKAEPPKQLRLRKTELLVPYFFSSSFPGSAAFLS